MNTVQRISAVSKEVQALLTSQMDMKTNVNNNKHTLFVSSCLCY
jgi:hypothetical protein